MLNNQRVIPGLVNKQFANWKDPPFFMGKSTISMVMFNSYVKLPEGTRPGKLLQETDGKKNATLGKTNQRTFYGPCSSSLFGHVCRRVTH